MQKDIFCIEFYGEPQAVLLSSKNDWVLIGGENLILWKDKKVIQIGQDVLKWIHDLRLKNENTVEILIDPWSTQSAVWQLDLKTLAIKKIKEFKVYQNKAYTPEVIW